MCLCVCVLCVHLVGEWAANHTPVDLLGGRMDIEPCPGCFVHLFVGHAIEVLIRQF